MSRTFTNSIAAFAAVILAFTSIGTIVATPSAQAQAQSPYGVTQPFELA